MVCSGFLKKFEETGQVGDQSSGAMTVSNNNNNKRIMLVWEQGRRCYPACPIVSKTFYVCHKFFDVLKLYQQLETVAAELTHSVWSAIKKK